MVAHLKSLPLLTGTTAGFSLSWTAHKVYWVNRVNIIGARDKTGKQKELSCLPCKGLQFSGERNRLKMHFLRYSGVVLPKPQTKQTPPVAPHTSADGGGGRAGRSGAQGRTLAGGTWHRVPLFVSRAIRDARSIHPVLSTLIASLLIHPFPKQAVSSLPTWHSSHTESLPAPITLLHIWVLSVSAISFFEEIWPEHNELKAFFSWRLGQKSLKDTPVLHNISCLSCTAMWRE